MTYHTIKRFSPEWYMMVFVVCIWAYEPLVLNISLLASKYVGKAFDFFFISFVVFSFLKASKIWIKKIKIRDGVFYISCIFLTILSISYFPYAAASIQDRFVPFFTQVITCYFVGILIDIKKYEKYIYWASVFAVLSEFLYFFVFLQNYYDEVELVGDLIVPATYTLSHVLVVLWFTFRNPSIFNIGLVGISILLLLSFANRGSIFATVLFIVFNFFFLMPKDSSGLFKIILVVGACVFYATFDDVMQFLFDFTQRFGMSAGFFNRMLNNEIIDSNGRDEIWRAAIQYISNSGFWGGGMGVDRIVLKMYSHNFALELLMDFGLFGGSLLIFAFLYLIVRSFLKTRFLEEKAFIAVLCGRGLIHLLLSGSYIEDGYFFLLIGYCVSVLRRPSLKLKR